MIEDFFLYFILACFVVVMLWFIRCLIQLFCAQATVPSSHSQQRDHQRRTRRIHRIHRGQLEPAPPPPYTIEGQSIPAPIFTVTTHPIMDDENKLPKYEDIFPTGPPIDVSHVYPEPAPPYSDPPPLVVVERY